jgi:hypothetical protein
VFVAGDCAQGGAFSGLLSADCNETSRLSSDLELLHKRLHILRHVQSDAFHNNLTSLHSKARFAVCHIDDTVLCPLMRPCLLVSACLLLVWCTVACALSRCIPLPVLPGVAHPPSAPSGVPRPKPLWGKAWSPICFFLKTLAVRRCSQQLWLCV